MAVNISRQNAALIEKVFGEQMHVHQNAESLGTEKLSKLMLKFSIPCILSLLVSSLYNIVDQIFIGNSELSTLGNAATGVVFPVFVIAQAFAWCIGDGCAAHLNICQGKGDYKTAPKSIGTGITVALLSSLVILAVFYPLGTPVLYVFGASEHSIDYAYTYLMIVLGFLPVFMIMNMMNAVIRADGCPAWAMASMLAGAITNIALDAVFIFACKWGMAGAAWATGIGQAVSFIISLAYFFRTKTFKLKFKDLVPDFKAFFPAVKLGISSFVTQITVVVILLLFNMTLVKYGAQTKYGTDIPIAIVGIESKVFTIILNLLVGIALGCQPIFSYNLGAKNYDRVKKLFKYILICAIAIGATCTLVIELAPRAIVGLFGEPTNIPNPDDYWEFGERAFRILLSLMTCTCVIKLAAVFFQAVGKPMLAIIASTIRDIICFVPLALVLPLFLGIDGILYAMPLSDLIAAIVTVILLIVYFRKLEKTKRTAKFCEFDIKNAGCGADAN